MESSIIYAWLRNIFWFLVLYGVYKMYRRFSPKKIPDHPGGAWENTIWRYDKGCWFSVRKATSAESYTQLNTGKALREGDYIGGTHGHAGVYMEYTQMHPPKESWELEIWNCKHGYWIPMRPASEEEIIIQRTTGKVIE